MSICKKCNTSIKPASLATYSGEDSYHPTCISCSKCQRPLWGRGFRRNKQRLLECEPDCESNKFGPQSIAKNKPANENGGAAPGGPPSGPGMPKGFRPVFEESQPRYPPQQQHQPPQNVPPQNNPPQNYPPQNYPDPHNPAPHNPAPHNAPQNYPPQNYPPNNYPPQNYPDPHYPDPHNPASHSAPQNYPPQNYPPQNYAPQSGMTPLPPIGQNYYQQQPSNYDPNSFRRQGTSDMNKTCKSCGQSLHNRRYLTYETGDMICQECDYNSRVPIPRVRSAHMIVCSCCGSTLQGTKYFTEKNGDIVCEKCDASGARCTQCKQLFRLNETRRTLANGAAYHAGCFMCSSCGKHIQTSEFYQTETRQPMCLDCYEISRLPKCFICNKHISGTYFMLDNKPVHDECFKCSMCAKSLGNDPNGFFRNKTTNDPICMSCNMKLNGARCARCGQVIEADGITFNSKDYHKQCFTCDSCGVELSKMKKSLTDRNGTGKFCEPCHIKLFAPKCAKCNQAIPPYLPFTQIEDKTYHKECFACSRCKQSLANKKFFKNGNLTLCEHCN